MFVMIGLRWGWRGNATYQAVGGVIVGLRAGLSAHADDNQRALALELTPDNRRAIAAVQARSNDLLAVIGDCGDEYRG